MTGRTISEAVVLAAGRGTRLKGVTGPKCMVDVGGASILARQFEALRMEGVRRIVLVTGFEQERVQRHAQDVAGSLELTFIENPEFATTNVLASWLKGSAALAGDHYYLHADTVFEPRLLAALRAGRDRSALTLTVDRHTCAEEEMKVKLKGAYVDRITKEMPATEADGEFTGILWCPASALSQLREVASELMSGPDRNRLFFEAALQHAIDHSLVRAEIADVSGLRWREIDFPEDLEAARQLFASDHRTPDPR